MGQIIVAKAFNCIYNYLDVSRSEQPQGYYYRPLGTSQQDKFFLNTVDHTGNPITVRVFMYGINNSNGIRIPLFNDMVDKSYAYIFVDGSDDTFNGAFYQGYKNNKISPYTLDVDYVKAFSGGVISLDTAAKDMYFLRYIDDNRLVTKACCLALGDKTDAGDDFTIASKGYASGVCELDLENNSVDAKRCLPLNQIGYCRTPLLKSDFSKWVKNNQNITIYASLSSGRCIVYCYVGIVALNDLDKPDETTFLPFQQFSFQTNNLPAAFTPSNYTYSGSTFLSAEYRDYVFCLKIHYTYKEQFPIYFYAPTAVTDVARNNPWLYVLDQDGANKLASIAFTITNNTGTVYRGSEYTGLYYYTTTTVKDLIKTAKGDKTYQRLILSFDTASPAKPGNMCHIKLN